MMGLPESHFPILPDVTDIVFEHNASHRKCLIKQKQVPIEPGFAITAHKAQGKTMNKVVVDLQGCCGTEQPYLMVLRCTTLEGLIILRNFDFKKITCRQSEDQRRETERLEKLRLQTLVKYGTGEEVDQARQKMGVLRVGEGGDGKKRQIDNDGERRKKQKRGTE